MESIKCKVMSLKLLHLSVIDLQCKSTLFLTNIALNFTSMTDKIKVVAIICGLFTACPVLDFPFAVSGM